MELAALLIGAVTLILFPPSFPLPASSQQMFHYSSIEMGKKLKPYEEIF